MPKLLLRAKDALASDLRFALRYFARHKATTTIIVVVLALGTGANTMIFSMMQAEFLRPAPAVPSDAGQFRIWGQQRATQLAAWENRGFTGPELQTLAAQKQVFSTVAAWLEDDVIINAEDSTGARSEGAQFVTDNFFSTLGVQITGRSFPDDQTAVMSYKMATLLYGNAANAIDRRVLVNEVPIRIVGVAPERFQGARKNMDEPALWLPLGARAAIARVSPTWMMTDAELKPFARLANGVSAEQAGTFVKQVVTHTLPDSAARVGMARTASLSGMRDASPGADSYEMMIAMTAILVIGALILLVAWMNVSSLMVAAAVGRPHEIAVRLSIGASRQRIMRQLITESTVLALTGGSIGLLLSWWFLTYKAATEIDGVNIVPDFGTFAFTLGVAVLTGVIFGLTPALHATRDGVGNVLRDAKAGSVGRNRLQRNFVVAQIMLSQPLLLFLGVMLWLAVGDYKPLEKEMSKHTIEMVFRPLEKTGAATQRVEAVDSLIPRLAQHAGVVNAVPQSEAFDIRRVESGLAKKDSVPTIVHMEGTAPGWFDVVDVPVVLGRDVTWADTAAGDYPVVIASTLARKLYGGASPIGRTLPSPAIPELKQDSMTMTVVGVYDASHRLPGMKWNGSSTRSDLTERVYTARGQHWQHNRVLVKTRGDAERMLGEMQKFVRAEAPSLPVRSMMTLEQVNDREFQSALKDATMVGAGGALALLLASLGLYGVVSLAVQQRTREIGIRIAVGAHPARVARMFLGSGVKTGAVALLLGLPLSMAALKIGMSQGVIIAPGANVYVLGAGIAAILLLVASLATWAPARRASRVDPSTTLRAE